MKRLCATVLVMEAIVIGLAIPVAIEIGHTPGRAAGLAGGCLAVAAVLLAGLVSRVASRGVLAAGSALQVLIIAAGVVVPVMYAVGAIFAGFWVLAIVMGRRAESSVPPLPAGTAGGRPALSGRSAVSGARQLSWLIPSTAGGAVTVPPSWLARVRSRASSVPSAVD